MRLPLRGSRVFAGGAVLASLLATACGPSVPVAVGIKNVPLDITVGKDNTPAAGANGPAIPAIAGLPPLLNGSNFVSYVDQYKQWTPPPLAASVPALCPSSIDPLKPSIAAADPEVSTTVPDGVWLFHQSGTLGTVPAPAEQGRLVSGASSTGNGTWQFYEASYQIFGLPGATLQITASNGRSGPSTPLVSVASQVGLGTLVAGTPDGHDVFFSFNSPLKLLATPAERNIQYQPDPNNPALPTVNGSWKSTASDPVHGSAMTIQGTDQGVVRDNVCGTPIDAWRVSATVTMTSASEYSGAIPTPAQTSLTLTGTYDVATGLGGLIVAESLNCSGTFAGQPYSCTNYTANLASTHPMGKQ